MHRFLLGLSFACTTSLAILACSSSSSSGSPSTNDGGGNGGGNEGGTTQADGGSEGGGVESKIPGDPPSATPGAIQVKINGEPRSFDGPATWTKFPSDGGTVVGFQTNARSKSNWLFVLAVFGNETGKTYTCNGGLGEGGGVSIQKLLPNGDFDPDAVSYGGTVTSEECSITLDTYSPSQGEHVTGTFTAELDLSNGDSDVTHLSLTEGTFDLVNFSDVPP